MKTNFSTTDKGKVAVVTGYRPLQLSPRPVIAILVAFAAALDFVGDALPGPSREPLWNLVLGVYAMSAIAWLVCDLRPRIGRWLVIVMFVATIQLADKWLAIPGLLALLAVPATLAMALISLPAATITAVGETLVLLLARTASADMSMASVGVALLAIWATLGVILAVYGAAHQLARRSWEHFQHAQDLLEDARDRQAELSQALADLAHANRQLALLNERMAAMRVMAEEAQRAKGTFVAKVSHEFRTPLNIIIGMVNLMMESREVYGGEFPPRALEHLQMVYRNCTHLSSMIDDVLDLSQIEAGRLALHRERVNLMEVIDSALTVVRPLMEQKGLDLQVEIPDGVPRIYCDRTRIRQVILNLLSNAARFTERGGITLQVRMEDRHVAVSVSDTGRGIPPEEAKRIFEPFSQGTSSLWHDRAGSGLGLSISKQFVELHNGRMWLESEPGVGSTFSFDLPTSPPTAHVARPGHWTREEWIWVERKSRARLPDSHYKPRVVICDETGELYPLFVRYSDEAEFVDTRNLPQAAQELRQCPAHAVILNAVLPSNLWPFVEKARLVAPDTPIVGCCCPPRIEHALEAGAVDYLTKPVTRADLSKAIEAVGKPVRRVLVVDDEADARQLLTLLLRACDDTVEVVATESGEQALEELHRRPPDLVLLDVLMPGMDGWQVLAIKREDEAIRDIPTAMVSAQDPRRKPMVSQALVATMGEGLSFSKLLNCSRDLTALLLQPD